MKPIQPLQTFGSVEIARIIQASPSSVQRWIDKKLIPSFRTPGGHRRVLGKDLLQFLALRGMPVHPGPARADIIGVDDDEFILKLLANIAQRRRPDLTWLGVSSSFNAGIEIMRHRPSLVFLDIEMPGVDGRDVCRMIKLSPELEETKVVIITGHSDPAVLESARKAGADDILQKPIRTDYIEAHLDAAPPASVRIATA